MAEVEVFKIDVQPVIKALAELGVELKNQKKILDDLKADNKEGTEEYIKQSGVVKGLSKEQNALNNVLAQGSLALEKVTDETKKNINAGNAQKNSIDQNRKAYNALYNQYIRADEATRKRLLPAIQAVDKTLKEQEKTIGDTRRSVGDYQGGIVAAAKELNVFGVSAGQLKSGLDAAKTGFQAAGGGVKGFSAALATTGIPIIIMAMQELFNVFQSFKPIADAVESSVVALKAAFGALISGGNIKAAVNQSLELLNVMRDLEDTQSGYNIQLERQNSQVEKLIIQSKDRSKTEEEKIKLLNEAETLSKKIYDDEVERNNKRLVSERNNLLQKSGLTKAELKLLAESSDASDVNFQKAKDKFEAQTKIGEAELKAYQETLLARAKLDGQRNKDLEKIVNLTNKNIEKEEAAQEKAQAAREKAADEAKTAKEKADQAEVARLQKLEALETEFQLTEREKLNKSFEDKLKTIQGNGERERLLRLDIVAAQTAALEKFDEDAEKKRQENQKRIESEIIANNAKAFNDKIAFNQKQLELELGAVDLSVGTEKEKERRKAEIQLTALEEQLRLTKQFLGPEGSQTNEQLQGIKVIEQAIAKAKENLKSKDGDATLGDALGINEEATKEAQKSLEEVSKAVQAIAGIINMVYETRLNNIDNTKNAEIDAINQSTVSEEEKAIRIQKAERDAANAKYQIQLKQFQANKATSIIQTIINTAQAVIAQFANPVPFAGAILSALAAATGAAQIAVIASQPAPPKPSFATGVIGLEGAGTATSDSIDARLSRGESVITARATERFAPILAQMELAVGNRPNFQMGNKRFATGFIPTGDGGYSTRNAGSDLMARNATEKAMMQAVSAMPAQKLVLEEFRNFETNVDKSVAISEL
jgi:hypothetical protein